MFTQEQIVVGKKLVPWLIKQGFTRDKSRMSTAILLKKHKLRHLKQTMQQSNCTSFNSLKKILEHKAKLDKTQKQQVE